MFNLYRIYFLEILVVKDWRFGYYGKCVLISSEQPRYSKPTYNLSQLFQMSP